MTLRSTNLNLLPILRALLKEGSVTRAASALGLSQPATSNALVRLRALLGDPLLVQTGRTMRLTPRAEELRPMIDSVCGSIETLLLGEEFVPARAHRDFVVATPDYMALLLGPALLRKLMDTAPGISVRFTDVGADFRRHLATGNVDIAIIVHVEDVVRGFHVQGGYVDRLVGVVASDHPLAKKPPKTRDAVLAYPRLGVDPALQGFHAPNELAGLMTNVDGPLRMSASHLLVLPLLVAQTRGVAIMPEALARQAAQMVRITQFELPEPTGTLDLCLMWSPALNAEPAHRWFRAQLDAAMRLHFRSASDASGRPEVSANFSAAESKRSKANGQ